MIGILFDAIYAAALATTSPLWLYRMIRHGRYRTGWSQRLGKAPIRYGLGPIIWVHGVSLGEVNAARTLVAQLHTQLPDFRVAISTTTDTGMAAAKRLFAPDHLVFHWPMDFSLAVRRALKRLGPSLVVLMEGEAWPNFLAECNRRDIPAVIVNGRMSADKGYPGYKRLGPLAARLFNRLTVIGVQDDSYARRFASLGVHPSKLHVTGMMKFDSAVVADTIDGQVALGSAVGLSGREQLIVAGGTGDGEEKILLDVYDQLKSTFPALRLAIVPRKPERFDEVARLISSRGLGIVRRSEHGDGRPATGGSDVVILGDTMGELQKFYALADCIFVGRSLTPMGGSDMIEAAALGKATVFGPHTFNFPQADALAAAGCVRVAGPESLKRQLAKWLGDPDSARRAGAAAQQHVRSQQGATKRNVEMICRVLGRVPAVRDGSIATDEIITNAPEAT